MEGQRGNPGMSGAQPERSGRSPSTVRERRGWPTIMRLTIWKVGPTALLFHLEVKSCHVPKQGGSHKENDTW